MVCKAFTRKRLPESSQMASWRVAESPEGDEAVVRVVDVKKDVVVLDGNHPLAGATLRYSVTVEDVRAATDEEIAEAAEAFDDDGALSLDDEEPSSGLVQLRRPN